MIVWRVLRSRISGLFRRRGLAAGRRDFGGLEQSNESGRHARALVWVDGLRQDAGFALRTLFRSRTFALSAILSLSLGVGATAAVFSLIDALILRPLPVPHPEQLVILTNPAVAGAAGGLILGPRDHVTFGEFETLRAGMRSFSGMFASEAGTDTRQGRIDGSAPEPMQTKFVSGEYFTVLGVRAMLGRTFSARDENGPGSMPAAVLSYAYWQRRFGGDRSVIERRIRIGDADLAVVGVAPEGFRGETVGEAPDLWIPLVMQRQVTPGTNWLKPSNLMWLHVIGRLRPGISVTQAQADADVVFGRMLRELSGRFRNPTIAATVLRQRLVLRSARRGVSTLRGTYTTPLYILMGFTALVLATACASVAALLLARATSRRRELDVRVAVGANRYRIFRQLLTESGVLAAISGIVAMGVALSFVRALVAGVVRPGGGTVTVGDLGISLDSHILLFTLASCALTVLVFGVAPAWTVCRTSVRHSSLLPSFAGTPRTRRRSGHALAVVQIALSVVLLTGAGWFVRTLRNLEHADLGYGRQIVQVRVNFAAGGHPGEHMGADYEDVRARLARVPGVRDVTYSTTGLLGDNYVPINVEDVDRAGGIAKVVRVSPGYFEGIGSPILQGRDIDAHDNAAALPVCVVNQALARAYFRRRSPVGRYIVQGSTRYEIVGVVRDARDTLSYPGTFAQNLRGAVPPTFYPAALQPTASYPGTMVFQLVSQAMPDTIVPAADAIIRSLSPRLSVTSAVSVDEQVSNLVRNERTIARFASAISGMALLLACIGLYGLLSHIVAARTNEIGVRMALGARRGTIVAMVFRDVAWLVLAGGLFGLPTAIALAQFVRSQLFGLQPADPETLAAVLVITAAVAALAAYLPARRASHVDPLEAIRVQ